MPTRWDPVLENTIKGSFIHSFIHSYLWPLASVSYIKHPLARHSGQRYLPDVLSHIAALSVSCILYSPTVVPILSNPQPPNHHLEDMQDLSSPLIVQHNTRKRTLEEKDAYGALCFNRLQSAPFPHVFWHIYTFLSPFFLFCVWQVEAFLCYVDEGVGQIPTMRPQIQVLKTWICLCDTFKRVSESSKCSMQTLWQIKANRKSEGERSDIE